MKVLVTGATGFIGKHVVKELLDKGCDIVIASRSQNYPEEWEIDPHIIWKPFDFNLYDEQKDYYSFFGKPDIAIHLAWQSLPNYRELFHIETNLLQQYNFLKNLLVHGLPSITVTGTCLEYGMQQGCLKEDMPALPQNAYALSKYTLYCFLKELKKQHPFHLNWIRLFYMYGEGQASSSLFSQLEAAIQGGDDFFNMSGGEQERDFLPVQTVARNIVQLALMNAETGLVNCCSGIPVKVRDWVKQYIESKNAAIKINLGYYPYTDYEPMSFWGDNSKLNSILK